MYGDDPREPPFDYDYQPQPEPRKRYGGYVIGALALAMFLGGIWVAYHQGVEKGVLRAPPLIKAEQGPTKVPPENPGGMRVPNQDKTIYDHMDAAAGNGAAATAGGQPVERLLPPPEEPAPAPPTPAAPGAPVAATSPPASTAAAQSPAAPNAVAPSPAASAPVASGTAAATTTGQSAVAAAGPANSAAGSSAPVPLLPPQPSASPSASPSARTATNAGTATAAAPEPRTPPAHPAAAEREQAMARGGMRIQLGAYRDQGAAQKDWLRLVKRYPDVLRRLHPEVTAINLGSRGIFQRLQAGPLPSRAAADEACAKLKAQKQGCIVVAH